MVRKALKIAGVVIAMGLGLFLSAGEIAVNTICADNSKSNIPQDWHKINDRFCSMFTSLNLTLEQMIKTKT